MASFVLAIGSFEPFNYLDREKAMKQPSLERIILSFQKLVGIVPEAGEINERETGIDRMEKAAGTSVLNAMKHASQRHMQDSIPHHKFAQFPSGFNEGAKDKQTPSNLG